jgi:hypothetical protein
MRRRCARWHNDATALRSLAQRCDGAALAVGTLDGDVPDGDVPDGDVPDGDVPDGDVPDGDVPDGAAPGTPRSLASSTARRVTIPCSMICAGAPRATVLQNIGRPVDNGSA